MGILLHVSAASAAAASYGIFTCAGLNPLSVRLYLKEWFLHKTTFEGVGVGQSKGGVVLALLSLQGRQQRQGRPLGRYRDLWYPKNLFEM